MKTLQINHSVAPIYTLKSYKKGQINHTGSSPSHREFFCGWYFLSAAMEIPHIYAIQKYIRFLHRTAQRTISIPLTTSHSFSLRPHFSVFFSCTASPPNSPCHSDSRLPFHLHVFLPFRLLLYVSPFRILLRLLQKADRPRITKFLSLPPLSSTRPYRSSC